jgi:hypothetical protein
MNTYVRIFTATAQYSYEPVYEDGKPNEGEIKRAAALITSEYDEFDPADVIASLASASPGGTITFPGGEVHAEQKPEPTEHEKIEQRYAERNEFDRLTPTEEAHRAKVLAKPYVPSPGFGPDGFPIPSAAT